MSSSWTLISLEEYFGIQKENWPWVLQDMESDLENSEIALAAMGMSISFLTKCLLDTKVIKLSTYVKVDSEASINTWMIIDA